MKLVVLKELRELRELKELKEFFASEASKLERKTIVLLLRDSTKIPPLMEKTRVKSIVFRSSLLASLAKNSFNSFNSLNSFNSFHS